MLAERCEACHAGAERVAEIVAGAPAPRWHGVTDAACRGCHTVADHQTNHASADDCASCHVEHRDAERLVDVATARCTACHGDLREGDGKLALVAGDGRNIRSFQDGHPEFAVWTFEGSNLTRRRLDRTPPPADRAQLKLNHALHLKPGLPGPPGDPRVQLVCTDCHQGPMTIATWRFGKPEPGLLPATALDLAPAEEPAYLAPVRYDQHCAGCHPHTFGDARFPDLPAPHDTPAVIRAFLKGVYSNYIVAHLDELAGPPRARPIGEPAAARSALTAEAWVAERIGAAEAVLFTDPKRCQLCHTLEGDPREPRVVPTRVPVRWLPHARFDHGVHRLLACGECHGAAESTTTADVLMPRREVCAGCHNPGGAPERCAECHTFHAATAPVLMEGRLRVEGVAGAER